jgi:hypothetical protein
MSDTWRAPQVRKTYGTTVPRTPTGPPAAWRAPQGIPTSRGVPTYGGGVGMSGAPWVQNVQAQAPATGWWGQGSPFPWGANPDWMSMYGNAPGGATEAMAWMNTQLPWYQQQQQQQQFQEQMGLQRWAQQGAWTEAQRQQAAQLGWSREEQQKQLDYQRWYAQGGWAQEEARQQEQLDYQRWLAQGGWTQEQAGWAEQAKRQQEQLGFERWQTAGGWEQQRAQQEASLAFQRWQTSGGWEQEAARQAERLASEETQAAIGTYGRRWRPNTRWM